MDTVNITLSREVVEEEPKEQVCSLTIVVPEPDQDDVRMIDDSTLDWSRFTYDDEEEKIESVIDWTRLLYGNEQIIEKYLNKQREHFPPHKYEYLFANVPEEERPILVTAPMEERSDNNNY